MKLIFTVTILALLAVANIIHCVDLPGEKPKSCPQNEKLESCGTACEPSCKTPKPDFCTEQCLINVCQCVDGFVRDHQTNKCVKFENCTNHL